MKWFRRLRRRRLVKQLCVKRDCPRRYSDVGLHYCAFSHPKYIKDVVFVQKMFFSVNETPENDDE
jgi:hypothetical protein